MLDAAVTFATACLGLALLLTLARLMKGPGACDRVLALDTLYLNAAALVVLYGIHARATWLFEVALLIAVLGFIGTVALAKFIERGDIAD
jgi:multicomponent K+:H+ antiporter subunit F